jgi:hypothetical protein
MVSDENERDRDRFEHVDESAEEKRARELRMRAASIVQIDDSELPQSVKDVLQGKFDEEEPR